MLMVVPRDKGAALADEEFQVCAVVGLVHLVEVELPVAARQLSRGYWRLYFDHVNQAHEGADLDFLVGGSGDFVPRDNH